MGKKSLIQRSEVDYAKAAHNCQASSKHRLKNGDVRLKVYIERSHAHYCLECALGIIERDVVKLKELANQLKGTAPTTTAS